MIKKLQKNQKKIVVLDDDPTGVQTVHDIFVYTEWSLETMRQAFEEEEPLFFGVLWYLPPGRLFFFCQKKFLCRRARVCR